MKNFKLTVLAAALVGSGSVLAADDGSLGLTSEGESIVTIIKEEAVQITNVADLDLGTHSTLSADASDSDDVCVFNSTANYRITVTSTNGSFVLNEINGGTDSIAYGVTWAANGGAAANVAYNTPITGLVGDQTALDCNGTPNATFGASVAVSDFNSVAPGTYRDTLTLLVTPE